MRLLIILISLFLMSGVAQGMLSGLDSDARHKVLGPQMEMLEDPGGDLSLEEVRAGRHSGRWQDVETRIPNLGYTDSAYWGRVTLPPLDRERTRLLAVIGYAVLDHVDVYLIRNGQVLRRYELGDRVVYNDRPIDHPNFIFPVELSRTSDTELYLRVETSSSMQIPLTLWEPDALLEHQFEQSTLFALFYGAMLIMAFYNLLVFFAVRDASYLYYVLYVISMVTLMAAIDGITFKVLWPNTQGFNDKVLIIALSGMVFAPAMFTRKFLHLKSARPRLSLAMSSFAVLALCTAGAAFFLPYLYLMVFTIVTAGIVIFLCLSAGVIRWWDGFYAARYYILAWSFMLGGGLVMALNKTGVVPRNLFTEHAGQIGAVLEILLLSFALANRMNHERRRREEAQRESAESQRQLLDTQIEMNRNLDNLVRERTEELEAANAKLREISTTDPLTALCNRRLFDETLATEYARAFREQYPLTVFMIDIDNFKALNDTYGHAFGDICLKKVADTLKSSLKRSWDLPARFGGEEFVAMLPNTDPEGGVRVAERVRKTIAGLRFPRGDQEVLLSVSIGVATEIPSTTPKGGHELLEKADLYLYQAKAAGRNRVSSGTLSGEEIDSVN